VVHVCGGARNLNQLNLTTVECRNVKPNALVDTDNVTRRQGEHHRFRVVHHDAFSGHVSRSPAKLGAKEMLLSRKLVVSFVVCG
jgi:hypothetical protein